MSSEHKKSDPLKPKQKESLSRKTIELNDPEIAAIIEKINAYRKDLTQKMEEIFDKTGLTFERIQKYLDDTSNFSPTSWEKSQAIREKLEQELLSKLGKETRGQIKKLEVKKQDKKRLGKSLGSRKNWIPIR